MFNFFNKKATKLNEAWEHKTPNKLKSAEKMLYVLAEKIQKSRIVALVIS